MKAKSRLGQRPSNLLLWPMLALIIALPNCTNDEPASSEAIGEIGSDTSQAKSKVQKSEAEEAEEAKTATLLSQLDKGFALPQEAMKGKNEATTISGEIIIEGYEKGLIQIDISKAAKGPQKPVTNIRIDKPGPFEIYVPKNMGKAQLIAILDIEKDGPGREDPRGELSEGPLDISDEPVKGLKITIAMDNVQATPPQDQPPDPNASQNSSNKVDNIDDDDSSEIFLSPDGN